MANYSLEAHPSHVSSIAPRTKLSSLSLSKKPRVTKNTSVKSIRGKVTPNACKNASSKVLKQHGYAILELVHEKQDVKIYHAKREMSKNLYKIEEYVERSHGAASLNYRWLKHENLLPYQDHFEYSGRYYFVADISRPNALKYIEEKQQGDCAMREALVRKWMGQLVKALKYCHRAALYLTDFDWRNTVIEEETDNLVLNAFDGMTDTTNSGYLQLGPKWNQPPELLRAGGCLRLSVPKIESWVVGCAMLELLIGRHLGKALEQSPPQDAITQAQAWFNIRTNLALLPFWLEGSNLSATSKEFVLWVLNEDSHFRPTIDDISHHSWIKEATGMSDDPCDTDLLNLSQPHENRTKSYSLMQHLDQSSVSHSQFYRNFRKSQGALMPLISTRSTHPLYQATESKAEGQYAENDDPDKTQFLTYCYFILSAVALFTVLYVMLGSVF